MADREPINLKKLNLEKLHSLTEDQFRTQVIIPLLRERLGADEVIDMQGQSEEGIDVYFQWPDIFGHLRRYGMQLKIERLHCQAKPHSDKNIMTICNQIQMAFAKEIKLPSSRYGKIDVTIDGFYIVTSKTINDVASQFIYNNRKKYPYIHVLEGRHILDIIRDPTLPLISPKNLSNAKFIKNPLLTDPEGIEEK